MIINLLINVLFIVINAALTPLISIASVVPDVPVAVINQINNVASYVTTGSGILKTILGDELVNITMFLVISTIGVLFTWRITLFIYRAFRG